MITFLEKHNHHLSQCLDACHQGDSLRLVNTISGLVLAIVLILATFATWNTSKPSGRLFTLGLAAYIVYGVGSSIIAMRNHVPVSWIAYLLPIANIWLSGAIVILVVEGRQERRLEELRQLTIDDYGDNQPDPNAGS